MIADDLFFLRWQDIVLWALHTRLGRLFARTCWNRTTKRLDWNHVWMPERIIGVTASSFTYFELDIHGRTALRTVFFGDSHFGQKVSTLLCWIPFEKVVQVNDPRPRLVLRPAFAWAFVGLIATLMGVPVMAATTSTFNTVSGASSPVDGQIYQDQTSSWSDIRNLSSASYSISVTGTTSSVDSDAYPASEFVIARLFFLFNTGGTLPAHAVISAAELQLRTASGAGGAVDTDSASLTVVNARPASDNNLVAADFSQITPIPVTASQAMTEMLDSGSRITIASLVGAADATLVTFTFNSTGIAAIARAGETLPSGAPSSGISRFAAVTTLDALDSAPTGENYSYHYMADNGSNKPTLSVTWTSAAVKYYFPSSGSAAVSPTTDPNAVWEEENSLVLPMTQTLGSTALGNTTYTPDAADDLNDKDALVAIFVSNETLQAQDILAQTVHLTFQCFEANAANNLSLTWELRVVSNDGSTLRGTLLSIRRDASEVNTSLRSITDSATSTAVTGVQAGDRLVLALGLGGLPTAAGGTQGHNGTIRFGESAAGGDLAEDETQTGTTLRPWLQFNTGMAFQGRTAKNTRAFPLGMEIGMNWRGLICL